ARRPGGGARVPGRKPRIFTALARWAWLRAVRALPDAVFRAEAARQAAALNAMEASPLQAKDVAAILASIARKRPKGRAFAAS
ncbi:MAG: hypothetical protein OXI63_22765, partial [Candidatus Poribacteria bacterium]|nr:hypothetical protein [Candidatus Poribacteria bacterium]